MTELFSERLLMTVQSLVTQHHTIYPSLPPQGVFFEALALRAFHLSGSPQARIAPTTPNAPTHDLVVGDERISIKTETGRGTRPGVISITKLCTTERDPWEARVLIERTMAHLSRYNRMLMLRTIWGDASVHYQLVVIPVELLRLIAVVELGPVGNRRGRRSLGGDVFSGGEGIFHVHFDGSDGKCQIRNLLVSRCRVLREWDQRT